MSQRRYETFGEGLTGVLHALAEQTPRAVTSSFDKCCNKTAPNRYMLELFEKNTTTHRRIENY